MAAVDHDIGDMAVGVQVEFAVVEDGIGNSGVGDGDNGAAGIDDESIDNGVFVTAESAVFHDCDVVCPPAFQPEGALVVAARADGDVLVIPWIQDIKP